MATFLSISPTRSDIRLASPRHGFLAASSGGIVTAATTEILAPTVSLATVGLLAGGGFLLLVIATFGPPARALRREIRRTLAIE